MKVNTITYNSAISALAKAARSESKQQRRFDYHPAATTTEGGNSDPGTLWRHALEIINHMEKERGLQCTHCCGHEREQT